MTRPEFEMYEMSIKKRITTRKREAIARARLYDFLLLFLSMPEQPQFELISSGQFLPVLEGMCEIFNIRCAGKVIPWKSLEELQAAYISTFDVGAPAPPVPLEASSYIRSRPVPETLFKYMRFYRANGISIKQGYSPDHLLTQLEFLLALDNPRLFDSEPPENLIRARIDFINKIMLEWIPGLVQKAVDFASWPYPLLLTVLEASLREEILLENPGSQIPFKTSL